MKYASSANHFIIIPSFNFLNHRYEDSVRGSKMAAGSVAADQLEGDTWKIIAGSGKDSEASKRGNNC
nr:hypothetical protein [Tanacetum cinerariifolium]